MACLRLAYALSLLIAKADLNGIVAVLFGGLDLEDTIAARFDDSRVGDAPLLIVETGHPEFLA